LNLTELDLQAQKNIVTWLASCSGKIIAVPIAMSSALEMDAVTPRLAAKLEAILYVKAQPLSLNVLAEAAGCDRNDVEEALIELMQDYVQRDSALEIAETDAGYSLQLKESFQPLVAALIPTDLGVGILRTLAAIALKGPIAQPDLIELRGSGVYQHVPELVERGFVQKRRSSNGRSYTLQVTEQFYQYFEVDQLPQVIRRVPELNTQELDIPELDTPELDVPEPEAPELGVPELE
jgi:segregation and condensation protein B